MNDDIIVFKEAQKICFAANNMALVLRTATNIQSQLIYYEEIFYFYAINDALYTIKNKPVKVQIRILDTLLKVLSHTDNPRYKEYAEIMKAILCSRSKKYYDILIKYENEFTPDFFLESFNYQSELLAYIKENDNFMNVKQNPLPFSEWIQKAAEDDMYMKIVNTLNNNIDLILDFINK